MSKYICVEDFANELKDFCCKPCKENKEDAEGWKCGSCSVMYLVGAVDAFSAADVEPVIHAKWVYNPNGMDWGLGAWQCSNCGYVNTSFGMDNRIHAKFYAGSKRCGSCGAKMDKE